MTPEWEPCTGGYDCQAERHVHGCWADYGHCDQPREHAGTWAKLVLWLTLGALLWLALVAFLVAVLS